MIDLAKNKVAPFQKKGRNILILLLEKYIFIIKIIQNIKVRFSRGIILISQRIQSIYIYQSVPVLISHLDL